MDNKIEGELMTFSQLKEREHVDIRGSRLEVLVLGGTVKRGTIEFIRYHRNGSLAQIVWDHSCTWDPQDQEWMNDDHDRSFIAFSSIDIEYFTGPFEIISGEICFMNPRFKVTIYPPRTLVPQFPKTETKYLLTREAFLY